MNVESYSIGFIPETARYGHPRRLFTIWFSANLQLLALSVGAFGTLSGMSLAWTILALLIGNTIGTIFMAAHSAQGPQLGVPQMIQSRAQFGVMGAALPLLSVVVAYTLYTALDAIIVRHAVQSLVPVSENGAIMLFGGLALIVAFVGYELIHRIGGLLSLASGIVVILTATVLAARVPWPQALFDAPGRSGFVLAGFLVTISQSTSWCLSASPYVADYSRYLPSDVAPARTFWYTAAGNFLGATAMMVLGAFIAQHFMSVSQDPSVGIPDLFSWAGSLVKLVLVGGVFLGVVMNFYSSYMSVVTISTGPVKEFAMSRRYKLAIMTVLMVVAMSLAIATKNNFDAYFNDVLGIVIYVLIPWSAINLSDYYLVRKGHYSIGALFNSSGEYDAFNWSAIAIYIVAIVVQVPFMRLTIYTGPIAAWLHADLSFILGLIVPAVLFTLFERRRLSRRIAARSCNSARL